MPTFDPLVPALNQDVEDIVNSIRANFQALDAIISGLSASKASVQSVIDEAATRAAHELDQAAHGLGQLRPIIAASAAELAAARGNFTALHDLLAVSLTNAGTVRFSQLGDSYANAGDVPSFVNSTTLTVPGNRTQTYRAGWRLRFSLPCGYDFGVINTSSFAAGVTTITLLPAYPVLAAGVSGIELAGNNFDNTVAAQVGQLQADLTALQAQLTALKFEPITGFANGTLGASQVLLRFVVERAMTLPAGAANSRLRAATAAAAASAFTLRKGAATVGTVLVSAAGTVGAFTVGAAVALAPGDELTLTAPVAPDAALANVAVTLLATLS